MSKVVFKNLPELPFDVTEALNQLRINIEFSGSDMKVLMITSCVPNEGKSFVSVNLWRKLAELGYKTLYIDSDLRNSEVRSVYGLSSDSKIEGIVHYLSGRTELSKAICETNIENGYLLPVVKNIPNPTIVLESELFGKMIEKCRQDFDYIIVDTPPLMNVADAMKIATYCDGSMLVVRAHSTPRKVVMSELNKLKRTGTPVLGAVLNRVNYKKGAGVASRYGRYGYYYKYGRGGYGYGADGKDKKDKK